jgi:hypothetical protein
MRSLRAHLREPESHGRLPFHPDCAICREERLAGSLPAEGVLSARSRSLLAASLLALSTAPPALAVTAEPDQEHEGSAVPGQSADPATDPGFDPEGDPPEAAGPPASPAPVVSDPGSDDAAAPEPEPTSDADAPIVDSGDSDDLTPPAQAPPPERPVEADAPPAPAVSPTPVPAAPAPTATPPSTAGSAPTQAAPRLGAGRLSGQAKVLIDTRPVRRIAPRPVRSPRAAVGAAVAGPTSTLASDTTVEAPGSAVPGRTSAAGRRPTSSGGHAARRGQRVHVVRADESLWSIAKDLLGGQASPARVAREVDRLWRLNHERIATGDPDLLAIGTRLRLR